MKLHINKLAIAFSMALVGCTHSISDVDKAGKTASPVFPDLNQAVVGEGSYVTLENISRIKPGMTKHNLYEMIGVPHFNEGVLGVKEWDYIVHIPTAEGEEITCQYKVLFDSRMKIGSTWFKPENCLTLAGQKRKGDTYNKDISAEALFAFAESRLSAQGVNKIRQVAEEIQQTSNKPQNIKVTGHTDRIGSQEKNYLLSLARAQAVKEILIEQGISPSVIAIEGMGSMMPRVMCPGPVSPAVIACLAENRRITIEVK
ncbi:OmpA family protein [Enterobacter ludwigii]|uniref:OmpA family protein n=1 Tax=Enterobacter ludwigii TaxID=299767 RepID=UPI00124F1C0A|nr:OmpA family protein [Enterobacter ludwigii]EKV3583950.1 OmpA family protein [Enterobacter ludwigii]MDY3573371.1 OmpA family protein [Enterobacter ludwigii]GER65421.1 hypothetical protein NMCA_43590 [Enterobacter ludwigii]HDR2676958.1 OmpA family protein [Enterobacter ludwigii]HDS4675951.1 OmpA family protein [Enterobacter ludwigii]